MTEQTPTKNFTETESEISLNDDSDLLDVLDIDTMQKISFEAPEEDQDDDEPIDYMAKDFASFRHALLQIASRKFPNWKLRSDADVRTVLIDLFSFVGDELSYYQDAVANEAFLKTARKRTSIQSHLALVDYKLHNGCSSSSFLKITVKDGEYGFVPKGFQSYTPASTRQSEIIFETDRANHVSYKNNKIKLHLTNDDVLSKNSTSVYLTGFYPHLKKGDYLLFEEGNKIDIIFLDANPEFSYDIVKRLKRTDSSKSTKFGGFSSSEEQEEALQKAMAKSREENPEWFENIRTSYTKVSCTSNSLKFNYTANVNVCANIAKITQGYQIPQNEILKRPAEGVENFVFTLAFAPLAYVSDTLQPHLAKSTLQIWVDGEFWEETHDLSKTNQFDKCFLVSINDEGRDEIRFGNGIHGKSPYPWSSITANYRVGIDSMGNVGRDTITKFDQGKYPFIENVVNPVPASGGSDPESLEDAKMLGPKKVKYQERAVTASDYSRLIKKKFPNVSEIKTNFEYSGSWNAIIISVDFRDHLSSDSDLYEIKQYVDEIRMLGYETHIQPAKYVSPEIKIRIHIKPRFSAGDVENRLHFILGNFKDEQGTAGFFHPDNFSFGEPIFVSRLYDKIEAIEAIDYAVITKFKTYDKNNNDLSSKNIASDETVDGESKKNLSQGFIHVNKDEIVLFNNDPLHPEQGNILLTFVENK